MGASWGTVLGMISSALTVRVLGLGLLEVVVISLDWEVNAILNAIVFLIGHRKLLPKD